MVSDTLFSSDRMDWGTPCDFYAMLDAEFGYSASYVYRLMDAARVERNISPIGEKADPIPESQLRPLARLEPEQQQEAWAQVVEENPDGKITGAKVQAVVDRIHPTIQAAREELVAINGLSFEELEELEEEDERGCDNCQHGTADTQADNYDRFWCTLYERLVYPYDSVIWCNMEEWEPEEEEEPEQPKPHVTHNSGNNEWYTPPKYIEAARRVMGAIDLDPASSDKANEIVRASRYYTAGDDGLAHDWQGRVWCNPPYSSALVSSFCEKLVGHVRAGDVHEACVLVNNATETGWFQSLLGVASCVCFPRSRIKFQDSDGNVAGTGLQGQAILYIGPCSADFETSFIGFGPILYTKG